MSQPIVVTPPHRLGKAEALRRLQVSFRDAQSSGAGLMVFKNQWSGDHMDFLAKALVEKQGRLLLEKPVKPTTTRS
jgi:hypothetical protein